MIAQLIIICNRQGKQVKSTMIIWTDKTGKQRKYILSNVLREATIFII
jgi:hypothetical protein